MGNTTTDIHRMVLESYNNGINLNTERIDNFSKTIIILCLTIITVVIPLVYTKDISYNGTLLSLVITLMGLSIFILSYTWGKSINIDKKSLEYLEEMLKNINELGYQSEQRELFLIKNDEILTQSKNYIKGRKEELLIQYEIGKILFFIGTLLLSYMTIISTNN